MTEFNPDYSAMKFRQDTFRKKRGGQATMIEIGCSCGQPCLIYQKDGYKGQHLFRLYLDRIFYPEIYHALASYTNERGLPDLRCQTCDNKIGTPILYKKENRIAYGLLHGRFIRKTLPQQERFR